MQNKGLVLCILTPVFIGNVIITNGYADTSMTVIDNLHISSFDSNGDTVYAGTWGYGLYCSYNMGKIWKRFNNGLTNMFIYSLHINDSSYLIGTDGGGIFKYDIHKKQWNALSNRNIGNTIFAVLGINGIILASSWSHGLNRSENNGKTWEKVTDGLADSVIYSLCTSSKYLYAGGSKNGVYQSGDRGKTWTLIGLEKKTVTCLFPVNNDIWCGTWESGLYYFNETDSIWYKSSFDFVDNIDALAYSWESNALFCANKNYGVFESDDYDTSWYSIGLTQYKAFSIFVLNNALFAGTWGNGIYIHEKDSEWYKIENNFDSSFYPVKPDSLNDSIKNSTAAVKIPSANIQENRHESITDIQPASIVEEKVIFINSNFPKRYFIPVNERQSGKIIIHLYDYSGKQVYLRTEIINRMEKRIISLDLTKFFTGVYVINIQTVVKEKPVRRILAH